MGVQERAARLERLRRAATAMAQRGSAGCASAAEIMFEHVFAHMCACPSCTRCVQGTAGRGAGRTGEQVYKQGHAICMHLCSGFNMRMRHNMQTPCRPCSVTSAGMQDSSMVLHAARGPASDTQYQFELENQAGQALSLAPAAREALVTGLALHDRAQRSLEQACAP